MYKKIAKPLLLAYAMLLFSGVYGQHSRYAQFSSGDAVQSGYYFLTTKRPLSSNGTTGYTIERILDDSTYIIKPKETYKLRFSLVAVNDLWKLSPTLLKDYVAGEIN